MFDPFYLIPPNPILPPITSPSGVVLRPTGSTQGLSKSAKRALELEKRRDGKGLKKLSELELAQVDRAKLRVERRAKEPEKKQLKSMFDLWDDAEVQENVVVKGTKDNDAVMKSLVEVDGNLKRNMAVGEFFLVVEGYGRGFTEEG